MKQIYIESHKDFIGCTEDELLTIKEELTIDNPKYLQALKFSKYGSTKIPKYLKYYRQHGSTIQTPRGYTPSFDISNIPIIDNSQEVTVQYPRFLLNLRQTQKDAFRHYIQDTDKGIIVLPTGKGKSILGCYIAYRLKQKTLIIVHKDDLVSGWKADAKLCFGDSLETGLIKAKSRKIGDQITIATIQTLNRLSKDELDKITKEFGLVILDEMHHCSSSSFDLVHLFNCAYKVGLTATPERTDGLTPLFNFHFGGTAFQFETKEGDEDILPVQVRIKTVPLKYEPLVPWGGRKVPISTIPSDIRPRVQYHSLENEVIINEGYMRTVSHDILREYKQGRSIILFLNQKDHCRAYYDYLKDMGIPKDQMQLYYGDSTESKDVMKRKAESKEVLITIATYSIATEGTNVKQWEVAFLVASINNEKNVEQAVGRIRRTKKGKINPVIVYDYSLPNVYTMNRHIYTRMKRYEKLLFDVRGGVTPPNQPRGRMMNFGGNKNDTKRWERNKK